MGIQSHLRLAQDYCVKKVVDSQIIHAIMGVKTHTITWKSA